MNTKRSAQTAEVSFVREVAKHASLPYPRAFRLVRMYRAGRQASAQLDEVMRNANAIVVQGVSGASFDAKAERRAKHVTEPTTKREVPKVSIPTVAHKQDAVKHSEDKDIKATK